MKTKAAGVRARYVCGKCGDKIGPGIVYCAECAARLTADIRLREHERATILAESNDAA